MEFKLWPKRLYAWVAVPPSPARVFRQRPLSPSGVSHVCRLMIRVIMERKQELHTDPQACILRLGKSPENLSPDLLSLWSHGLQPKSFQLMCWCQKLLSRLVDERPLDRSVTLVTLSAILELRKISARRPSMKAVSSSQMASLPWK